MSREDSQMGYGKDKAPVPPPSPQMNVEEAKKAIKKYKGKQFSHVSALVRKINQDKYKHQVDGIAKDVAHGTVRTALMALGITSTGSFTLPRKFS